MNDIIEKQYCDLLHRINVARREALYVFDGELSLETEDGVPVRKLFVGNLAKRTKYKDLAKLFSKYGEIESCFLQSNQGRSNCAFVTFSKAVEAVRPIEDASRMEIMLHNRYLRVTPAYSWHQPENIENLYCATKNLHKLENKLPGEEPMEDCTKADIESAKIHMLNDDCLIHIFLYLPIMDRIRIERVCKRWRAVSQLSWHSVKRLDMSRSNWASSATISDYLNINTAALRKVLLRCGRFLNEIDFSQTLQRLNNTTLLGIVGKLCPNLQTIDATELIVSPPSIRILAKSCRDITKFSLGPSTGVCDAELTELFKANPKLQYLRFDVTRISGDCLAHLPSETIEKIFIHRCDPVILQPLHIARAIVKFNNLKTLSFNVEYVMSTIHELMGAIGTHCKKLKSLKIFASFPLSGPCELMSITQLNNLEVLTLWGSSDVTDEFLINLSSKCLQLTYLNVSACPGVTATGLAAVATLPRLEKLVMNYLSCVWEGEKNRTVLRDFWNLKQLQCRECYFLVDEDVSSLIERSPQLELLDLAGCGGITNETLKRAVVATCARKNNVILKIFVNHTWTIPEYVDGVSPLLQIVRVESTVLEHLRGPVSYMRDE